MKATETVASAAALAFGYGLVVLWDVLDSTRIIEEVDRAAIGAMLAVLASFIVARLSNGKSGENDT